MSNETRRKARRFSFDELVDQDEDWEREGGWKTSLEFTQNGGIRATFNNCRMILEKVSGSKAFVGRNEFAAQDYYTVNTPWRSKKGDPISDVDIVRIKSFCCERFGVEFGDNTINQVLIEIADQNRFHPVRDYIRKLSWDGEERIETWLSDYAGAVGPDKYLRAISRKVLVAMVARVFRPGVKFDHVLILEGIQGTGKSTMWANLAGEWFSDQPLLIGDKDAIMTMQNKWLIEFGELAVLNRGEIEHLKAFITQKTDRIRVPYGRRAEDFPRQCIFVGSTNRDEYLKDDTGNRRFWPVKCEGKVNFAKIAKVRDQLFAEAYAYYQMGETLYLESEELNEIAKREQAKRSEWDELTNAVAEVLESSNFATVAFEMRALAAAMPDYRMDKLDKADQMRLAKALRELGFEKFQEGGGQRRRLWRKKDDPSQLVPTRPTIVGTGKTFSFDEINDDFS